MIVPFHSMNKRDRIEFYGDPINRQLRDKILRSEYNVKTDMENLIQNIVTVYSAEEYAEHGENAEPYDIDEILYWVHGNGGYKTFDLLIN